MRFVEAIEIISLFSTLSPRKRFGPLFCFAQQGKTGETRPLAARNRAAVDQALSRLADQRGRCGV